MAASHAAEPDPDNFDDDDLGFANSEAALHWHGRGYNVLPQKGIGQKHPAVLWKQYQSERVSRHDLRRWGLKFINGVGFVTGAISDAIVVETDGPAGATLLAEFERQYGTLPETLTIRSGSGRGLHRHFKHPGGRVVARANPSIQIDVKGDGGYCVLPPTQHRSGGRYEIVHDARLADVPQGLLAFIENAALASRQPGRRKSAKGPTRDREARASNVSKPAHPKPPVNRTNVGRVQAMLNALPASYADNYWEWLCVGFALHEFSPDEIGLALWRQFSKRCPRQAGKTDFEAVWMTLGRPYTGNKIGLGWLCSHAARNGWRASRPWDWSTMNCEDED